MTKKMNQIQMKAQRSLQEGKIGYVFAWLLGVPLPVLALYWLFFGR